MFLPFMLWHLPRSHMRGGPRKECFRKNFTAFLPRSSQRDNVSASTLPERLSISLNRPRNQPQQRRISSALILQYLAIALLLHLVFYSPLFVQVLEKELSYFGYELQPSLVNILVLVAHGSATRLFAYACLASAPMTS